MELVKRINNAHQAGIERVDAILRATIPWTVEDVCEQILKGTRTRPKPTSKDMVIAYVAIPIIYLEGLYRGFNQG